MSENHGKRRREIGSDSSPFDSFPEDCICKIVSCTSPRDACVVATVSKAFESAAKSDVVWEKFLPPGYESLCSFIASFLIQEGAILRVLRGPCSYRRWYKGIVNVYIGLGPFYMILRINYLLENYGL